MPCIQPVLTLTLTLTLALPLIRYAGTGYTQCRKCGMYDYSQLTNGVPNGVDCTGGQLNGIKKGF